MSAHREVQSARDTHGHSGPDHSTGTHAAHEAAHLLRHHGGQGHLRELPSNPAAAAATTKMEITGTSSEVAKKGDSGKNKEEAKIINTAGHNLVDDLKHNGNMTDRTYHRIEGLVQNEYKDHGLDGVQHMAQQLNDAFVKAQAEAGWKGPPTTFELGNREGNFIDAHIVDGKNKGRHNDLGFSLH